MQFFINNLPIIQVILSVILVTLILMQQSDAALGGVFGGSGGETIEHTRRGAEKVIFQITIAIAILFALSALAAFFLS